MPNPTTKAAYAAIDAVNSLDPTLDHYDGQSKPAALWYGERMTECLDRRQPDASLALRIAVRAQHIERWSIARSDFPMDRAGYHRWRTALGQHHAQRTQALLQDLHATQELIDTVGALLRKENLKRDADTQILEDTACLVFLQYYLRDFSRKHSEVKLIGIIQKTWRKMSSQGQLAAMALALPEDLQHLIGKALAGNHAP